MQNFVLKNLHLGEFGGKVEILSTRYNLLCRNRHSTVRRPYFYMA